MTVTWKTQHLSNLLGLPRYNGIIKRAERTRDMTIERAKQLLKFAEEDMMDAHTHSATVHSMNRVAHWRRVLADLTMKESL